MHRAKILPNRNLGWLVTILHVCSDRAKFMLNKHQEGMTGCNFAHTGRDHIQLGRLLFALKLLCMTSASRMGDWSTFCTYTQWSPPAGRQLFAPVCNPLSPLSVTRHPCALCMLYFSYTGASWSIVLCSALSTHYTLVFRGDTVAPCAIWHPAPALTQYRCQYTSIGISTNASTSLSVRTSTSISPSIGNRTSISVRTSTSTSPRPVLLCASAVLTQPGIRLETERDLMVWRESEKEKRWQEQEFSPKRIQEQPANTMQGHMLEEFQDHLRMRRGSCSIKARQGFLCRDAARVDSNSCWIETLLWDKNTFAKSFGRPISSPKGTGNQ